MNHLKCPACVNPGSPMPSFAGLGEDNLRKLASFLEASKGGK
jgi:cytochrome c1